ncbi:ModE molybdate transport repressor domain-containing protein [Amycolatopsis lurida]|uniref:LysR family transcriptional regulator n=1 Tax=Amycolatopsis lurida NRRL 2430 TaxID=1460371 RepID=A0A2P2FMY0_AMYLU|nr:LysR substrate-binding domain-containing protein [Amycolatopsis lurida]KFU78080.1 LysR family transcriptional regulator [Amycolatopsis lurida NRRL 2430]SEC33267.1 ModE molybdate transport repressor domain-containing protein [Amycolatopsis lurida]
MISPLIGPGDGHTWPVEIDVRHLRLLDAIASAGSMAKAATALGLSQPALSTQLHRVERALERTVFERDRHGVRPTALGEVLLDHARRVLAAADDLELAIRRFHSAPSGEPLRIGALPTVFAEALSGVVAAAAPGRPVELLTLTNRTEVFSALRDGTVELALYVDHPGQEIVPPDGVHLLPVGTEPVFVAVSPEHPAAARGEVSLADLDGSVWLLPSDETDEFPEHLADQCARAGLGAITVRKLDPMVVRRTVQHEPRAVAPTRSLDSGSAIPGPVVALRGVPLRTRHLLLWRDGSSIDVPAVRSGLMHAIAEPGVIRHRLPAWAAANPGWLGT